jgi:hypothetical protein
VADGTRTHDDQNHNLGLYQLSYSHRRALDYSERAVMAPSPGCQLPAEDAAVAAATAPSSTLTLKRVFSALKYACDSAAPQACA